MVIQNVMKIILLAEEKCLHLFFYIFGGIEYFFDNFCCHGNHHLEYLKLFFCICITDVDYLKYVENYSYSFVLEGDNLLLICPFC